MQRTWADRRRIIFISLVILILSIAIDLVTKVLFKNLFDKQGKTVIIENFFYFTYTENSGSAFSFLADKLWSQLFFKILTGVALVAFGVIWYFSLKKKYTLLSVAMAFVVGGTIGNFVDRLVFDSVRDFIGMTFFGWNFPIFNIADVCLTVGVILFMIHFLFIDNDALFKKKDKESKVEDDNLSNS